MRASFLLHCTWLFFALAGPAHAGGGTCTWTGSSALSNGWSDPLNWLCGSAPGVPGDGDELVFPEVAARKTNLNDLVDLEPTGLVLTGASYDMRGNPVLLLNGIIADVPTSGATATDPILRFDIALDSTAFFNSVGPRGFEVAGVLTLGSSVFFAQGPGDIRVSGTVQGGAAITKAGTGTLVFSGANTYTGATTISQGVLNAASPTALGAATAGTTVAIDGTLALTNTGSISEPLVMGSSASTGTVALRNAAGNNTWKGPITLQPGSATIETVPPHVLDISGGIGGDSFAKVGAGTLVLSTANTYTGTTDIQQGTLRVQAAEALGSNGDGTVVRADATLELANVAMSPNEALILIASATGSGGVLSVAAGNCAWQGPIALDGGGEATINTDPGTSLTVTGVVSDPAGLQKHGAGTLILTAANTYGGSTTIHAGIVRVNFGALLGDDGGATMVLPGTTLEIVGHPDTVFTASNENLTLNGSGVGGLGAVRAVSGATVWSGPVTLASTTTIGTDGDAWFGLSGTIATSGPVGAGASLTKVGTGTLALSGGNTYGGLTTIEAGVLLGRSDGSLGAAGAGNETVVLPGATLTIDDGDGASAINETLVLNGPGATSASALRSPGGNNSVGGTIVLAQDATIEVGTGTLTLGGNVEGSAGLSKVGTGTLVLSSTNTYGGQTTVTQGILQIRDGLALGSVAGATTIANGAALELADGIEVEGEPLTVSTGALRNVSGNNFWTGPIVLAGNPSIDVITDVLTLDGATSGSSGLTKVGTGTLVLSNANTYDGTTTITAGTLRVQSNAALGAAGGGTTVNSGATLQLQGSLTIAAEPLILNGMGALENLAGNNTWSGPITLQSSPTIGVASGTLTLGGAVSGSSGVTKIGAGVLQLANTNTYTGTTTVNEGTLSVSGSTGAIVVAGTGRLIGSGSVGAITLGGTGSLVPIGSLEAASLTWNDTASVDFLLGPIAAPADRLILTGALTKGTGSSFLVRFADSSTGPPEAGLAYVLAMYASTTFVPNDFRFTYNGQPGMSSIPGAFFVTPTQLEFEAETVALFVDGFE